MKTARIVSVFLFYLTRLLASIYLFCGFYTLITVIFKTSALKIVKDGRIFQVCYPFTQEPFLVGEYYASYIIEMVGILIGYGMFFWWGGNVFETFQRPRLFTPLGVRRLKIFYTANLLVPAVFLIFHIIYQYDVLIAIMFMVLHAVLGIFAYFMAAIFKQGLALQAEQDLYI